MEIDQVPILCQFLQYLDWKRPWLPVLCHMLVNFARIVVTNDVRTPIFTAIFEIFAMNLDSSFPLVPERCLAPSISQCLVLMCCLLDSFSCYYCRELRVFFWQIQSSSWLHSVSVYLTIHQTHQFQSKQSVALMGRNMTGPVRAAPGELRCICAVLQTTTDSSDRY